MSHPQPSSAAPSLDLSLRLTREEMTRVNACILSRVGAEIPLIRQVAEHIVASGGKRLRPVLTLLAARACGYEGERHMALAAAVECIHTATLLHDDVVDASTLRRGEPTANEVFGNKTSVLVGDFLLAQAFQLMVADGSLNVLRILSDAAATISRGEVKQLITEGDPATSEEAYLDVISSKTAALFSAACEIGAVVADTPQHQPALQRYGQAVGMAFQLVDDALDYGATSAQIGKTAGDDFREGKITLPVLLAWQRGNAEERAFWERSLTPATQRKDDFAEARHLLARHRALEDTFERARTYCAEALEALQSLPSGPASAALAEIVDFCAGRMY